MSADTADATMSSPLLSRGGFAVLPRFLDTAAANDLLAESLAAYNAATLTDIADNDAEEGRGGSPARRFFSAPGGAVQAAIYNAPWMAELLTGLAGITIRPTGAMATFSYYVRPGDHIDVHRDILTCDVAVITCLIDRDRETAGGGLVVYPSRTGEPLSSIRGNRSREAEPVPLRPFESAVLFGGLIPHRVHAVAPGQQRVVSVMCFEAMAPPS
ncbi:MAG TPA: hypothetical protein VGQ46_13155 [Thermoanaerobaculia bacterium]|jgi:hypothetical protein|nr:hypothetical protein [Thermoanaerobaculia bacterium]